MIAKERGSRFGTIVVVIVSCVILVYIYRLKHTVYQPEQPKPFNPRQTVRVQVLNGCGVAGVAGEFRDYLMKYRVDIREIGNAVHRYPQTIILDRIGNQRKAIRIAELLGVSNENVIQQINENLIDIDVTVIVGGDHALLQESLP